MKHFTKITFTIVLFFLIVKSIAQVGISATAGYVPNPNAMLDISSTSKGLLIPRMNTAQRSAISPTPQGLQVYDTQTNTFWYYNGTTWINLGAGGAGPWAISGNNISNTNTGFVGINKSNPQATLDLGGNMAITGEIKPGGISGTAGQILQNNGNGTMSWFDKCDFPNSRIYYQGSNMTFTVPNGITKLWIEVWGAGAGGNSLGGGGGGGYASMVAAVVPNSAFTVTVGQGGNGGSNFATSGGGSSVDNGNYNVIAYGGHEYGNETATASSVFIGGIGSADHTFRNGIFGHSIRQRSIQLGSQNFFYIVEGGEGGDTYGPENVGSAGVYTGPGVPYKIPEKGKIPGGGGGAGGVIINSTGSVITNNSGSNGADGRVIIHW